VGALKRCEPRGVRREDVGDDAPVLVVCVAPELRLDALVFMKVAQRPHHGRRLRPEEIMVTGDGEQKGARAEVVEVAKEPLEDLGHAVELGGCAGLRQIPGEHDEVPRAGALREPLDVLEELLADGGQERPLLRHALM
jgi:hypothetical protein